MPTEQKQGRTPRAASRLSPLVALKYRAVLAEMYQRGKSYGRRIIDCEVECGFRNDSFSSERYGSQYDFESCTYHIGLLRVE